MKVLATLLAALVFAVPHASRAAGTGDAAPAFQLPDASGGTVALESLRGKVVLLDFWASWCAPCRRSFPWMAEMQRRYGSKGFAVVAVNVDRRRADADRFLDVVPAGFVVAFDPAARTPPAYAVPAMPTSYLIDARGRIVHVEQGFHDDRRDAMEERIRALLAGSP